LIHNFLPNNKKSKRNNPTNIQLSLLLAQQHHKAKTNTPLQDVFQQPTIDPTWHELAFAVTDPETGEALEYKELLNHSNDEFRQQWQQSAANEFGRLAQGIKGRVEFTDAIDFIHFHEKPKDKKATYGRVVCTVRPPEERTKPHPHHCRGQSH
jgi:hypothetical protein